MKKNIRTYKVGDRVFHKQCFVYKNKCFGTIVEVKVNLNKKYNTYKVKSDIDHNTFTYNYYNLSPLKDNLK